MADKKTNKFIKDSKWLKILIITFAIIFLLTSILFRVFGINDIWTQLTGTLLGTIITAIVTVLLLGVQTDKEIGHDRDVGIFEKKQEVYHNFINELEKITQDGKMNVPGVEGYNPNDIDELQHLIYQLGFVQMHANKVVAEEITKKTGELLSNLSLIKNESSKKDEVYSNLAEKVFDIVSLMKKDLYNSDEKSVSKDNFKNTLRSSGAFDNELLSVEGRIKELELFLKLLISQLKSTKITSGGVSLRYRTLTEKDDFNRIAKGYINIQTERWILISFPIPQKSDYYCYITFDDKGDFWVAFKDKDNKDLIELNEKYKQLQPKDTCIGFLVKTGDYKVFARLTAEGKNQFVKNLVDGIERKINELFDSKE